MLQDIYSSTIHMGDFCFYQIHIISQYLLPKNDIFQYLVQLKQEANATNKGHVYCRMIKKKMSTLGDSLYRGPMCKKI